MVVRAVPCGDVLREEERVLHHAGRPQTGLKGLTQLSIRFELR